MDPKTLVNGPLVVAMIGLIVALVITLLMLWRKNATQDATAKKTAERRNPEALLEKIEDLVWAIDAEGKTKENLREKKGTASLETIIDDEKKQNPRVLLDDLFNAAIEVRYAPPEIAALMHKRGYDLFEIAEKLGNSGIKISDIAQAFWPLAPGETPKARVILILNAIKEGLSLPEGHEAFTKVPIILGCDGPDTVTIAKRYETPMWSIMEQGEFLSSPKVTADLYARFGDDPTSAREYRGLRRSAEIPFDVTATILRAYGCAAGDIIEAEYQLIGDDKRSVHDVEFTVEAAKTLEKAGFADNEPMFHFFEDASNYEEPANRVAILAEAAIALRISTSKIASLIRLAQPQLDIKNFAESLMYAGSDQPLEKRLDILNLIVSHAAVPATA